eukprot:862280_1
MIYCTVYIAILNRSCCSSNIIILKRHYNNSVQIHFTTRRFVFVLCLERVEHSRRDHSMHVKLTVSSTTSTTDRISCHSPDNSSTLKWTSTTPSLAPLHRVTSELHAHARTLICRQRYGSAKEMLMLLEEFLLGQIDAVQSRNAVQSSRTSGNVNPDVQQQPCPSGSQQASDTFQDASDTLQAVSDVHQEISESSQVVSDLSQPTSAQSHPRSQMNIPSGSLPGGSLENGVPNGSKQTVGGELVYLHYLLATTRRLLGKIFYETADLAKMYTMAQYCCYLCEFNKDCLELGLAILQMSEFLFNLQPLASLPLEEQKYMVSHMHMWLMHAKRIVERYETPGGRLCMILVNIGFANCQARACTPHDSPSQRRDLDGVIDALSALLNTMDQESQAVRQARVSYLLMRARAYIQVEEYPRALSSLDECVALCDELYPAPHPRAVLPRIRLVECLILCRETGQGADRYPEHFKKTAPVTANDTAKSKLPRSKSCAHIGPHFCMSSDTQPCTAGATTQSPKTSDSEPADNICATKPPTATVSNSPKVSPSQSSKSNVPNASKTGVTQCTATATQPCQNKTPHFCTGSLPPVCQNNDVQSTKTTCSKALKVRMVWSPIDPDSKSSKTAD